MVFGINVRFYKTDQGSKAISHPCSTNRDVNRIVFQRLDKEPDTACCKSRQSATVKCHSHLFIRSHLSISTG